VGGGGSIGGVIFFRLCSMLFDAGLHFAATLPARIVVGFTGLSFD
jgi:hypothetical protein